MARLAGRLIVFILPLIAGELRAQVAPAVEPPRIFVHAGLGAGGGGFAFSAGADLGVRNHLVSLRAAATAELFGDDFSDVAILYGRSSRWSSGMLALSTGLALVQGTRCDGVFGGCIETSARFGVPLAARLGLYPLRFLGVGLYGFANFNSEQPFGGVTLIVEVGRVR
jgi:hypothetical protein